ncbi:alpha/beta hydrolase [Pyxidicoccus parkwayensis]|uniref:Alpha/beta hydrolase n=1 Tax=Pyxidicoccus parkwayensis TaxID=2813578 RepID=A0ABX7P6M9_9BACT|nr:alpha/beta hydrolase [Pyxidicoccus parkwaysis]QSQ26085.1 alpha/beta hydrolase [Pyxidicoccus parkwaysis]
MDTLPPAQRHDFKTGDGVQLWLTRYQGGTKGPVLLVHGAGVWSGMFMLPTLKENFVQFLVRHGYDTWLVDWRASVELPLRQFTLDEAAEHDMPGAVRKILEVTKASSVQAVAHCAGSTAFFMSLAMGRLPDVRSAVASQVALHHIVPPATHLKAMLRLPEALDVALDYLSPDEDPKNPVWQTMFGKFANLLSHECDSTVCHRLTFMYGHLYRHARLNRETHERLEEQFGPCNMLTFRHLAQMARAGHALGFDHGKEENVRRYGRETPPSYLRAEHLRLPITFLSGEQNGTYLPESTELTFEWLREENGADWYQRKVLEGYGHLDTFMGSTAARDTYPVVLEALQATG